MEQVSSSNQTVRNASSESSTTARSALNAGQATRKDCATLQRSTRMERSATAPSPEPWRYALSKTVVLPHLRDTLQMKPKQAEWVINSTL